MIVMHTHTSFMKHDPCVFICAHLRRARLSVGGRVMDVVHRICKVTALSFPLRLSIHPSDQREDLDPSVCVSCIQSIHTQAAAARITRRCCTTSQLVIALVLHVCWYTYLNACTPVDIRAHYTCVQMAETGCPAGVQTARASTVSVLETPCVLMRIGALRINT